jgi:hypothetical protein
MLTKAIHTGVVPPEKTMTVPRSLPAIEDIAAARAEKARIMSV